MFPGYPAGDVRLEIIERELYIDEIKANQGRIGPLACCIDSPRANLYSSSNLGEISQNYTYPTTKIQNPFRRIIGCNHHCRLAIKKASPEVMVHSITDKEGVRWDLLEFREEIPVKDVPVIGNRIWCLSWRVVVVFATTLFYKLVLLSPGLCHGKGGSDAHVKKRVWKFSRGYCRYQRYGASSRNNWGCRRTKRSRKGLKGGKRRRKEGVGQPWVRAESQVMTTSQHSRRVQRFTSSD
jgi:hypothetical protein